MTSLTAAEIARRIEAELVGDGAASIIGVAGLREAQAGEISFLGNPKYAGYMAGTRASAVVVPRDWTGECPAVLLRVDAPDKAFGEIATWFLPPPVETPPGVHPNALVDASAVLGDNVSIGPFAVVEAGARIGDGTRIGALCYIGAGVSVGGESCLWPLVSVRDHCRIGERAVIHGGAVIGSDGFGFAVQPDGHREKIPQLGIVEVGDDVEIGANVTVDRARFGRTRIGNRVKIDNLVHVAHNVVVEDDVVLVAQVGISGSTVIRKKAILAGQVGVGGHLEIGEGAICMGQAGVTKDLAGGKMYWDTPAIDHKEWARMHSVQKKLPVLKGRVEALEKRIAELEAKLGGEA